MSDRDELIAKARALRADATGGKWKAWGYLNGNPEIASAPGDGRMESIATVISFDRRKENQAFIAGAAELLPALADLAESEGRRADEAEAERSKSDGAYEALFKRSSNSINTMRTERDAALAELAALKGQQP